MTAETARATAHNNKNFVSVERRRYMNNILNEAARQGNYTCNMQITTREVALLTTKGYKIAPCGHDEFHPSVERLALVSWEE